MKIYLLAALLALAISLSITATSSAQANFTPIPREELCVTEGKVEAIPGDQLSVDVPKMRAFVNKPTKDAIQMHFTYVSPTGSKSQLGSGASRVQFGLKLRAEDACNL